MCVKIMMSLLLLETIHVAYTATTSKENKLIQNLCESLHDTNNPRIDEDQQWELLCKELFSSSNDYQNTTEQHNLANAEDISQNKLMRKAVIRTSGIRTGSRIRIGGGGTRRSPPISRYYSTRTGTRFTRPNGWLWSRTALIFLPLSRRFLRRSSSSSNRFTTSPTNPVTYYYCTSDTTPNLEIQCTSATGDSQCCEDEATHQAFCCGGDIPDDIQKDMNRTTQKIARIFYTLASLALCMHLFMRRFYR